MTRRQNRPPLARCPPIPPLPRHRHPDGLPARARASRIGELISEALGRGRNARAIWQDLVDDHGFASGYASVRRFVITLRGATPIEARVIITTAPGEEGQVDHGEAPMVREAATVTLGFSRKAVRLVVCRSNAQIWAELHERAFRRLGGTL